MKLSTIYSIYLKTKKMLKNAYDSKSSTKNLVTTITGVITLIITILVGLGVITPEQSTDLQTHTASIIGAVSVIWGAVAALILIFKAKD